MPCLFYMNLRRLNLFLLTLPPFSSCKKTFFNVKREGLCLQDLRLRRNIYFSSPYRDDAKNVMQGVPYLQKGDLGHKIHPAWPGLDNFYM